MRKSLVRWHLQKNSLLDKELTLVIAFDTHRRRSPAYGHFDATITRVTRQGNVSAFFQYQYTCKLGHAGCVITQKRNAPTDKLLALMRACDGKHKDDTQSMHPAVRTRYDPIYHRMLAAMRCAASNRPFLSTEDYFYKLELQHISPGE